LYESSDLLVIAPVCGWKDAPGRNSTATACLFAEKNVIIVDGIRSALFISFLGSRMLLPAQLHVYHAKDLVQKEIKEFVRK
jgi:hypothetical protein